MHRLQEGQERCFGIFREHAGAAAQTLWDGVLHSESAAHLAQLRKVAERTSAREQVALQLAEIWFDTCTQRIDAMREVENLLAQDLLQVCTLSIGRARAELDNRRLLSRRISQLPDADQPMLFSMQASALDDPPLDGVSPELHRSILDRVHEQARRLQQLDEELAQTRALLEERRKVELAKRRLENELGLSEKAAHEHLQRISMESGTRLVDVATQILS